MLVEIMCQITIGTEEDEIQIDDFNNGKKLCSLGPLFCIII